MSKIFLEYLMQASSAEASSAEASSAEASSAEASTASCNMLPDGAPVLRLAFTSQTNNSSFGDELYGGLLFILKPTTSEPFVDSFLENF